MNSISSIDKSYYDTKLNVWVFANEIIVVTNGVETDRYVVKRPAR